MNKTLHILNGDSTRKTFTKSGIKGETAVWREMLSDGLSLPEIGSEQFWHERKIFFLENFEIKETTYQAHTIQEIERIKSLLPYADEVVLWFEHDWFCQINLIGLLNILHQQDQLPKVKLVYADDQAKTSKHLGLGNIPYSLYPQLLEQRVGLETKDYTFAREFWKAYTNGNPNALLPFLNSSPINFPYFQKALAAHLLRFPSTKNGLNSIQEQIIKIVAQQPDSIKQVVQQLLQWDTFLGFGDLQYYLYFKQMTPFFESILHPRLNPNGKALLSGHKLRSKHRPALTAGGCELHEWGFNAEKIRFEQ